MATNHRVWHSGFFGANIQMQEDNFDQKKESQFDILHCKNQANSLCYVCFTVIDMIWRLAFDNVTWPSNVIQPQCPSPTATAIIRYDKRPKQELGLGEEKSDPNMYPAYSNSNHK